MKHIDRDVIDGLVADLRDLIHRTGLKRAVIGLSGGIDSALSCNLAVLAIGRENVFTYYMPYKLSSQASRDDAELMAGHLGVSFETVELTAMAEAYPCFGELNAHRLGNILSRLRMITLFDKSAAMDALVLGTGNKSEIMLGYMTWFGDSACAVNPLGDMYKTQVYEAARLLGIPDRLITKAPSADLCEGQTDKGDLGFTYAEIDRFLEAYVDEGRRKDELTKIFGADFVKSITGRMERNAHKRNLPVILSMNK